MDKRSSMSKSPRTLIVDDSQNDDDDLESMVIHDRMIGDDA